MLTEAQSLKHRAPGDGFLRVGESLQIDENGNVITEPELEPEPELDIDLEFEMVGFEDGNEKTG